MGGSNDTAISTASHASVVVDSKTVAPMKFKETYCSQCGGTFGPGDSGYSHCADHRSDAGDYYETKSNDAKYLRGLLEQAMRVNAPATIIEYLKEKLEVAEYTGD